MDIFLMVISSVLSFYWVFLSTIYSSLSLIFSQLAFTEPIPLEFSLHPKTCLSDGTRPRQVRVTRVVAFPGDPKASTRDNRTWRGRAPSERQVNALTVPPSTDSLRRYEFSHPQMGTVFRLVMYTESETLAKTTAAKAFAAVDSLNACMSDYLPGSELNRLCNTAGSGKSVQVSNDLWQILKLSNGFSRQSGGAFDATVGPLTRLWRRARNLKELPDSSKVEEARQLVGFQNIVFKKGKKIELKKAGMRLDLGGIAQGYAADRCLEILRRNGIRRALADAGGDIALGDAPPGEIGWVIEIPSDQSEAVTSSHRLTTQTSSRTLTTLRLANCGVTTSGATFRFLEAGGKRYSHIIDPHTGWGLTHRVLVTVQAPDATTADAWATAISVMGKSGWNNWKRKQRTLKVWLTETPIPQH